jgi:hypothetical protein
LLFPCLVPGLASWALTVLSEKPNGVERNFDSDAKSPSGGRACGHEDRHGEQQLQADS